MIGIEIIWVTLPLASTADEPNSNDWEYSRNDLGRVVSLVLAVPDMYQ